MKKILALILAGIMLLSLCACSNNQEDNQKDSQKDDPEIENQYQNAVSLFESGEFSAAKLTFDSLGEYKETKNYLTQCEVGVIYEEAYNLEKSDIQEAYNLYATLPSDFYLVSERMSKIQPFLGLSGEYYGVDYYAGDRYETTVNIRITIDGDTVLVNGDHSGYSTTESGFPESFLRETAENGYDYEFSFKAPGNDGTTVIYINATYCQILQKYNGYYNYELYKVN